MRWKAKPRPNHGDTRVRWRFLSLPERYGNEWHWLESEWHVQSYDVHRGWRKVANVVFDTKHEAEHYAEELQEKYQRFAAGIR